MNGQPYIEWLQECHQWYVHCCIVAAIYQQNRKRKACAALLAVIAKKRRCKRKIWVAPLFQLREESGFYKAIFPTLQLEDLRFHNYLRMSATQLENLLQIVGADIFKQYVVREPIEAGQRLVLTLRYQFSV